MEIHPRPMVAVLARWRFGPAEKAQQVVFQDENITQGRAIPLLQNLQALQTSEATGRDKSTQT